MTDSFFSEANLVRAKEIVARYPHAKSAILPLCQYYAYLEVGHARDDGGEDPAEDRHALRRRKTRRTAPRRS